MSELEVGRHVRVCGLKANPELNGQSGLLLMWDEKKQRWLLQLDDGSKKMLRAGNLIPAAAANAAEAMRDAPTPVFQAPMVLEQFQWYEVAKSMVFVKQEPFKDAHTVALARLSQKLEVLSRRVFDAEGHWWAELTAGQLRRSGCKDEQGQPATRGYVLVDASHLGLGLLMRGPLEQAEWPKVEELEPPKPPEPKPPPPPPAAAVEEEEEDVGVDFHWYEVCKGMVFVKCAPEAGSKTVAIAQLGQKVQALPETVQDGEGRCWAELTGPQVRRLGCDFEEGADEVAFLLLDGSDLGLGRLLEGPLPRSRWPAPEAPEVPEAEEEAPPAAGLGVELLQLEVQAEEGAAVHVEPSATSEELARLGRGECVDVDEETFDGWARLLCGAGWVRRRARHKGRLRELLARKGEPYLARWELAERPGRTPFEVLQSPYLYVRAEPSDSAEVKGSIARGGIAWAECQRYDGWLRLIDEQGWARSASKEGEKLLHAPLFTDVAEWCERTRSSGQHWAHGLAVSFGEERAEDFARALAAAAEAVEPEKLLEAIKRARAVGLPSEDITAAEYRLEELRRLPPLPEQEAAPAPAPAASTKASRELQLALEDFAKAAKAGQPRAVKAARSRALAAGADKKELARLFALHGST